MNIIYRIILTILFSLFLMPTLSVEIALADGVQNGASDSELSAKYEDFSSFAKSKVRQLNRNHKFSRSRMKVTRLPDGTYRARYHRIDDSSLSVKVRRSQSSKIPFVGVLSYQEQVFESSARTPEQFDDSMFAVVKIIPNRHIFSYQKGSWN